jgi:hypothetical protein
MQCDSCVAFIDGETAGKIELKGRGGIRRKQLLDGLKETRGYCKSKEEALDRPLW